MYILGLDLSTKSSGFAYLKDEKLLEYSNIIAKGTDTIDRIYKMRDALDDFLSTHKVDVIVLEEALPNAHGGNVRTEKVLFYLHAAIDFLLHDKYGDIPVEVVYPSSWRAKVGIRTGKGIKRTELKQRDIEKVKELYNIDVNDDVADSILIGLSYIKEDDFFM